MIPRTKKRESIQKKIDDWHKSKKGSEFDKNEYFSFLKSFKDLIEEKNTLTLKLQMWMKKYHL